MGNLKLFTHISVPILHQCRRVQELKFVENLDGTKTTTKKKQDDVTEEMRDIVSEEEGGLAVELDDVVGLQVNGLLSSTK